MSRWRKSRASCAAVVLAAAFGACRDGGANAAIQANYDNTGYLRMLTYDSNGNGKPDTWTHMQGQRIARIEIDADEDGTIDRTEFYEGGVLARAEVDTDGNGNVDKWETYANGLVTSVAFDTEGAGRPTRRIQYDPSPAGRKR
jgi:hypothetical protein